MFDFFKKLFCFQRKDNKDKIIKKGNAYWIDGRSGEQKRIAYYTRIGEIGRRHVVTSIHAGFSIGHDGVITLQSGNRPSVKIYCNGQRDIDCKWVLGEDEAFSVSLAFSAEEDEIPDRCVASIAVMGYTEDVVDY